MVSIALEPPIPFFRASRIRIVMHCDVKNSDRNFLRSDAPNILLFTKPNA